MMYAKRQILTAAILAMAAAVCAQENELDIDAQLRTRLEHNHGAVTPIADGEQSANFIGERTRLSMAWKRNNLEMKASAQHTGVWGQDNLKQQNGHATINEAWAKLTIADDFFVQLGRQQLAYDDERLLGAQDWSAEGNWHDALRAGYESGQHKAHIILAMNQTAENNRGDYYAGLMPYKSMQTAWYHYDADILPLDFSVMAINLGLEIGTTGHGRTNYLQTIGADVNYWPEGWHVHAACYYQRGKDVYSRKANSWMASAKAEYEVEPRLCVNLGYDHLSGGNNLNETKAFNALFGTHHNFYGAMDYFPGTLSYGLHDLQAGAVATPLPWIDAKLDYHFFATVKQVTSHSKPLGHELDFTVTAKAMRDITVSAGYSAFVATKTFEAIKGGSHDKWQGWGWLQVNINPRVLSAKW